MISPKTTVITAVNQRTPTLSSDGRNRAAGILHEFQPVIWRLVERYSTGAGHLHRLAADLQQHVLYLAEVHDPADHGPLRPYLLRGITSFVANYDIGTRPAISEAISQLPARQRQAFEHRYIDRLSIDEISTEMGIRPASVRSLLQGAIENLRRRLTNGA